MRTAIVGTNGLLGGAFLRLCLEKKLRESVDFLSLDLPDFDVTSRLFSLETLCEFRPDVILNLSGINLIDWLEKKPNTARTVHIQGTANLREAAKRTGALLVHLSCAEVFGQTACLPSHNEIASHFYSPDGFAGSFLENDFSDQPDSDSVQNPDSSVEYFPFRETDSPEPVSVYAKTKLDSERAAAEAPRHLIIRTGTLFGRVGKNSSGNIVETLLNSLRRSEKISVIDDLHMSLTWSDDLAKAIFALIECGATGLYHVANPGDSTPFELAKEIARLTGIKREFVPISTAAYGFVAPHAQYTILDTSKYNSLANMPKLSDWKAALASYIESRNTFCYTQAGL